MPCPRLAAPAPLLLTATLSTLRLPATFSSPTLDKMAGGPVIDKAYTEAVGRARAQLEELAEQV